MKTSPTKRTLDWLRSEGWLCQVVEHWNAFAQCRIDLFGGIDIVGLKDDVTLGVQACTTGDQSKRFKKLAELPGITAWLRAGNELWIVGWALKGPRGQRKTWQPNVIELELDE